MANADGSVIFSCDLDSTKAQKKLSKLRDKISELNGELEKETGNKLNLEKQLDAASQAAKVTGERVKALRKEVEQLNDREWIQKQGFTQNEYQAKVLDRRAAAEAELKQQEALLHTQTKEVKTLSAAYEETTANIDSMTVKLDKAKVAAGELIANTEQERREREAENSALAKAGQYAARFRDQVKSLARSIVTPGVGTVVGMGLGLILGLSIYSVRKDPKKGTQRLVSIGRSVLLGLLAGVLGVGLTALGIVSAGTAFIISAAIGLALKFFVDSVDDSKVRKATSGFTGTRVSTKTPTRSRRVAAQNLDGNAPVYNEIPALASGAVIPPNRKFLAVLGDQKSGTNVEAPLSTIKQAVMEAMAQGSREPINVNLVVDGKTLARVVVPNINNMTRAAGKPVLLY